MRAEVMPKEGILILEEKDGQAAAEFPGFLFGAPLSTHQIRSQKDFGYGEVVFNTSMTGYQEILTDPSYYGQIICMTAAHIGNTGINPEDPESARLWCAGFIIHENCEQPSNWRSQGGLDEYLKKNNIPGLYGVDTRALTRHLRKLGVCRGVIVPREDRAQARTLLAEKPSFEGRDLIAEVSTQKPYFWPLGSSPHTTTTRLRVVAVDFGVKWNLLKSLYQLGCDIEVVPASTTAPEILKRKPNGVFLSNGPGDPSAAPYAAKTVAGLIGKVPIFGVCMGHQILALALGGETYKLKFGHRGGNQPVLDSHSRHVEISSHNHGYAVDEKSLPNSVKITHINLNDHTVEGLEVQDQSAFSVQYHPEACPGPHDSTALFEKFVQQMKGFRR